MGNLKHVDASKATAWRASTKVSAVMAPHMYELLTAQTPREKEEASRYFYDVTGIPFLTAAFDGCHIPKERVRPTPKFQIENMAQ